MATWSARWVFVAVAIAAGGALVAARGCEETAVPPHVEGAPPAAPTAPLRATPHRVGPPRAAAAEEPAGRAAARDRTVLVRVLADEDGSPIPGATVGLAETGVQRTTGADGVARFESIARGKTFCASAPGRVPRWGECDGGSESDATLELRLVPGVALRVRVEDRRTGAPIAGAAIDVEVVGDDATDEAKTGDDGERVMPEPIDLILRVKASARGYDESVASVRTGAVGTSPPPVVLRLARLGRLTGVVRGPDGVAVPKAFVVVAPESAPLDPVASTQPWSKGLEKSSFRVFADDQGAYAADGLVPGRRYHAFAREAEWVTAPGARAPSAVAEGIVASPDSPDVAQDLVLQAFGRLIVRVVSADGTPAAPTTVTVSYGNGMAFPRPDMTGTYVADRLPPGTVTVSCLPADFAPRDAVVTPGGTAEVTLDQQALPMVRGTVVDDAGRPVSGAEIEVRGAARTANGSMKPGKVQADAEGVFVATTLRPGDCHLTATAPGHQPSGRIDVQAPSDDVRVVLRRAAAVTFRATTDSALALARSFDVTFDGDPPEITARSVGDGTLRVDCEPLGDTRLRIYTRGLAPVVRSVTLTAGAVTDLGELRFETPRAVRVHVADAAGRAVSGAGVAHDSTSWADRNKMMFVTDADGSAVVFGAPPAGPLPLRVHAHRFLDLRTIADVEGDAPIALTITRGGLLWGEAVDADGAPRPDADVRVADARGADVATMTADRHGQFDVRLAPGRYTVRAGDGPGVSVELTEGRDEHVQLVAPSR